MEYNITHKDLINIENISENDYDFYLDFFSEGSIELRNCLETLWKKKLFTSASCKGHDIDEREYIIDGKKYYFISLYAYISMKPNCNILEYLSKDLLTDPYIHFFRDEYNRDTIYIYGRERLKKIKKLTRDINSGIKDNNDLIYIFNNKMISKKILKNVYREYYYDNNFYFEEIKRIEELNDIFSHNFYTKSYTEEQMQEFVDEENKILKMVRTRKINNSR